MKLKNFLFSSLAITGLIGIIVPVSVVSLKKQKNTSKVKPIKKDPKTGREIEKESPKDSLNVENIYFPEIDYKNYYKYIRYENGKVYWDKKIVPNLVQFVIKNFPSSEGKIFYKFTFDPEFIIDFKWEFNNQKVLHRYKFEIDKTELEEILNKNSGA
ncbi:MHO_1590 family protein [Mycoplasmopsis gallinarum]|uniref:MHO_1590 family protein n=1 Tax=Mycoplasmopsis gallinarum TaxID=29557 RepID=UPI000480C928|nr:hypothetical protein [Mycoplasmopsis gallinarum]